jgi:RNA recognition motif-containing protein
VRAESLGEYFGKFGPIESSEIIRDPHTGKSRGFGFVTFANQSSCSAALREPRPLVDGRRVDVKQALTREAAPPALVPKEQSPAPAPHRGPVRSAAKEKPSRKKDSPKPASPPEPPAEQLYNPSTDLYGYTPTSSYGLSYTVLPGFSLGAATAPEPEPVAAESSQAPPPAEQAPSSSSDVKGLPRGAAAAAAQGRRIFVGGLHFRADDRVIAEYFTQFGPVESADVQRYRDTGQSRGFAFVTFGDSDSTAKALTSRWHSILGRRCEVKPAFAAAEPPKRAPAKTTASAPTEAAPVMPPIPGGGPLASWPPDSLFANPLDAFAIEHPSGSTSPPREQGDATTAVSSAEMHRQRGSSAPETLEEDVKKLSIQDKPPRAWGPSSSRPWGTPPPPTLTTDVPAKPSTGLTPGAADAPKEAFIQSSDMFRLGISPHGIGGAPTPSSVLQSHHHTSEALSDGQLVDDVSPVHAAPLSKRSQTDPLGRGSIFLAGAGWDAPHAMPPTAPPTIAPNAPPLKLSYSDNAAGVGVAAREDSSESSDESLKQASDMHRHALGVAADPARRLSGGSVPPFARDASGQSVSSGGSNLTAPAIPFGWPRRSSPLGGVFSPSLVEGNTLREEQGRDRTSPDMDVQVDNASGLPPRPLGRGHMSPTSPGKRVTVAVRLGGDDKRDRGESESSHLSSDLLDAIDNPSESLIHHRTGLSPLHPHPGSSQLWSHAGEPADRTLQSWQA